MAKRRERKSRSSSWAFSGKLDARRLYVVAGIIVGSALAAAVVVLLVLFWPSGGGPSGPRAAIVDQLALTDPNDQFVADATSQLTAAGYAVDYFAGDEVNVDLYRRLPSLGYRFVLLRSHSAWDRTEVEIETGARFADGEVGLFTNELYSNRSHLDDQYAARLGVGSYIQLNKPERYFVVGPEFITSGARGKFKGTVVVLMGCAGLKTEGMARAFEARRASSFVSWDESVTATHTDAATSVLLRHLLEHQLPAREAVDRTMAEVGPDPSYGARLAAYP